VDLHIVGPEPTADERGAVDALLGPPDSGWEGGVRDFFAPGDPAGPGGRAAHGGIERAKERRDLLLPALHAVQDRVGWVSHGAINYICRRLIVPPAEAWGVLTFYHLFATEPRPAVVAHVCDDIACRLRGAEAICRELDAAAAASGQPAATWPTWQRSPCLGLCDQAPAAIVVRAGITPSADVVTGVRSAAEVLTAMRSPRAEDSGARDITRLVPQAGVPGARSARAGVEAGVPGARSARAGVEAGVPGARFVRAGVEAGVPGARSVRAGVEAGAPGLKLLRRVGVADPSSLDSYRAHGGYRALLRAIERGPEGIIAEVTASNLLGRGGAAFPAGRKWDAVRREPALPHFLVCNADESEPGTFKDRILLEEDPFALVEAMTIAGHATGCERAFLYIRGEYALARNRMQHAIDIARAAGLLGPDVMDAGFAFDIEVRRGAGAYICGEETALLNSLEGRRGEPRAKPPFPAQVGLFGKPTVVNNVETLANVLDIVVEGGARWAEVGTPASTGTRLFCVSGHVDRPGLYELPFGRTLGDLLTLAGGVAGGRALKGILLGGAAGTFVAPDALSMPLTFEGARAAGATLGSGVVMVFDEAADLPDTLSRIADFFQHESCGQCVPCRVGTVRQSELLARLRSAGGPLDTDLALLGELGQAMRDASICGLGQTASSAIETAVARLQVFRGERP